MKRLALALPIAAMRVVVLWLAVVVLAAACSPPGTDGINLVSEIPEPGQTERTFERDVVRIALPHVPAIRLPDLSAVQSHDDVLQERLGALDLAPTDGVEIVEGECAEGQAVYQGDESSDIFADSGLSRNASFNFEIDPVDGSADYLREDHLGSTRLTNFADGSGEFVDDTHTSTLTIEAAADGSGKYFHRSLDGVTTVEAKSDRSGVYYHEADGQLTTITLGATGSGELYVETDNGPGEKPDLLTIDARPDGSGDLYYEKGGRTVTLRVRSDRSWEYDDRSFGQVVSVVVNRDGSGQYTERGTEALVLDFDADGTTIGPTVVLPDFPTFVVADSFPPLGTLASIDPPCATVLRFDSTLLFEVDKAVVLPGASKVLADIAPSLIAAGRSIDINGHTDANGSDEHNQHLSERRAAAVAEVLQSLGVNVTITVQGFGESQPVAGNYLDDGSDDEAGQRENRRVELVVHA